MRRVIPGLLIVAGWLLLLFYGPFILFWLILTGVGGIALSEYFRMAVSRELLKEDRLRSWLWLLGLLPLLAAYSGRLAAVSAGTVISLLFFLLATLLKFSSFANAFEFMARAGFGLLYVSYCLAHVILIRALPHGASWLLLLTSITIASDTAAYYTGQRLGKTKLCPAISPGKTREGAIGGLIGGVLAALGMAAVIFPGSGLLKMALIALGLAALGIIGDLAESVVKRSTGVKDSGRLLAGHGGLLDRGDSFLITAPVLFYLLEFGLLTSG